MGCGSGVAVTEHHHGLGDDGRTAVVPGTVVDCLRAAPPVPMRPHSVVSAVVPGSEGTDIAAARNVRRATAVLAAAALVLGGCETGDGQPDGAGSSTGTSESNGSADGDGSSGDESSDQPATDADADDGRSTDDDGSLESADPEPSDEGSPQADDVDDEPGDGDPSEEGTSRATSEDPPADGDDADLASVEVYFANHDRDVEPAVFSVPREVEGPDVLTGAIEELLAGPTEDEVSEGYRSLFSDETAGMLHEVTLEDGSAHVSFDAELRDVIPGASSSTGSTLLLDSLDATSTQFSTVDDAVYSLEGDVEEFYGWLQRVPPEATADRDRHEDDADPDGDAWTTETSTEQREGTRLVVTDLRVGVHDGFDRVTFEIEGDGAPGWRITYDDEPQQSASGQPVELAGDAALFVSLTNVAYPMDAPVEPREGPERVEPSATAAVVEVLDDLIFEAHHDFWIGVDGQRPYRVQLFEDPTRVVIDIATGETETRP